MRNPLESYKKLRDKSGTASILNNLGFLFYKKNQYDSAYRYYQKSIEINKTINNKSSLSLNYNNLADVLTQQNQLDSVLIYAQKSLSLASEVGNQRVVARANIIIGRYYNQINQF